MRRGAGAFLAVLAALVWLAAEAAAQSPRVVRTAPINMTGLGAAADSAREITTSGIAMTGLGAPAASAQEITTPAIRMTGHGAQAVTINTGRIEMTGRR